MKLVETRPFADPEAADRKIIEIANTIEPGSMKTLAIGSFLAAQTVKTLSATTVRP